MIKLLRNLSLLFTITLATPITVFAQAREVVEDPSGFAKLSSIPILFENILGAITVLGGFAALMMLIFGGFRYIVAQGDPKAVQAARGTLTWAIVGLVMIIVAWLILAFLADFLNLPLTKFCLGTSC
jgi:uncharacterized membrane protein